MADLCIHMDLNADAERVLMRCGWPEKAHASNAETQASGLITDHKYECPGESAPDDLPAEIWETRRRRL